MDLCWRVMRHNGQLFYIYLMYILLNVLHNGIYQYIEIYFYVLIVFIVIYVSMIKMNTNT